MPAEWETHRATWLTWPTNKTTWPGRLIKKTESIYLQVISALLPYEKIELLVRDKITAHAILKILAVQKANTSNLNFHKVRTADSWIRDYGPIFITRHSRNAFGGNQSTVDPRQKISGMTVSGKLARTLVARNDVAFTKWIFNAWGGKYPDLAKDHDVVDQLDVLKKHQRFNSRMIFEGGSIDVNGQGTCLTTEQCLLNSNRNPKLSKEEIERNLKDFLGIGKVIWLKRGIEGDDTDGHVDDMARFVGPRTVVTAVEHDRSDMNYVPLNTNLKILRAATDQKGRRLRVIELPTPGRVLSGRIRLPASYANFYIANQVVLVPVYSRPHDKSALKIIQRLFPGRKVIGIECTALVHGLGSIHCVTQQEPM